MTSVEPNGEFREVPVDDLFFSTTDQKGLIQEANDVFVKLSSYSLEELQNQPHNIIRHPFMPGGAFREMWERLQEGKTFAGYVRNLAKDGTTYDVYATVTPIPGTTDFLSVRQRPSHQEHMDIAMSLYEHIGGAEKQLREEGASARDAAARGQEILRELLNDAGFPSFNDYQNVMLPWEVSCREDMSEGLPQREGADPAQLERLNATHAIHQNLDEWMNGLEALLDTAEKLTVAKDQLLSSLGSATEVQQKLQSLVADSTPLQVLLFQLNVWISMQQIVDGYVKDVVTLLEDVVDSSMQARFDISVARLHATMLATFVAEIIDGRGNVEAHERQLTILKNVVRDSVGLIDREGFSRAQTTRRTAKKLKSLVGLMESPSELLRDALQQAGSTDQQEIFGSVQEILDRADAAMSQLTALAERLEGGTVALDVAPIYAELDKLAG